MKKTLVSIAVILTMGISASVNAQEIKFWMVTPSNEAASQALQDIAKEFNKNNPNANVVIEGRSIDQHKASLRIAATSNEGPDIFFSWAGFGLGGEYVKAGLSAPMDKYYAQYKWADKLLPAAVAFSDQYGGAKHGIPYTFRGEAIYYNKALFTKAGITQEPQTYNELLSAAEKLKQHKIPAITFGGSVNWHLMRLMDVILETKCGADKHDALNALKLKWNAEACVKESFNEFHKWTSEYMLKPFMGFAEDQSYNLFAANRAAMMLEGDWLVGKVVASGKVDEVGLFPFPTETNRLYGFAEYLYLSSKGKNIDMAAKFLDYLSSTEVQQKYLGIIGSTSVNKSVVYKDQNPLDAKWVKIFNEFSKTFVNGDQALPLQVTTEYFRIINNVATDQLSPDVAGDKLQEFIDKQ